LYKSNEYAREFIKLLRDGSTRVKASVGGLIPKVLNKIENGVNVGNVIQVLWNNMALTTAPVNPTVGPAVALSKSLTSAEFVKALQAGYGTDSATFSGGRALQKEEVGNEKINLVVNDEAAIESLVGAVIDGDVKDLEEAEEFLNGFGVSKAVARDVIQEIVERRKDFLEVLPMAKSSLWESAIERLKKSLGGKSKDNDELIYLISPKSGQEARSSF
jgi:predicted CopG family antitoxin